MFLVLACGWVIHINCKSRQALIVDIDAPRVHRRDQNVESQVKLKPINQERVLNILRNDALLVNWHFRDIINLKTDQKRHYLQ